MQSIKQFCPCRARENHRAFWWRDVLKVTETPLFTSTVNQQFLIWIRYTGPMPGAKRIWIPPVWVFHSVCIQGFLPFPSDLFMHSCLPMGIYKLLSPCFVSWASVEILVCAHYFGSLTYVWTGSIWVGLESSTQRHKLMISFRHPLPKVVYIHWLKYIKCRIVHFVFLINCYETWHALAIYGPLEECSVIRGNVTWIIIIDLCLKYLQ